MKTLLFNKLYRINITKYIQKTIFCMGVVFCLSVGYVAHADIVINEIAWMGTATSTADEWIELYNNGTSSVNMDGWSLSASDGSPVISLSGSISAGGYAVLERTDDTTVPGVTALVIYSGALSNDGEHLILKNNTNQTMDEINALGGWTKGDADTKKTMQKNSGVWVTGIATPGLVNVTTDDTSSSGGSGSGSSSGTTTTTTNKSSFNEEDTEKIEIYKDPTYSARMVLPNIIVAGNPFPVSAIVMQDEKYKLLTGKYEWSMGDGEFFTYNENKLFDYTYQYPGEYIIQFRYYPSIFSIEPSSLHERKITVIPDAVYIEKISDSGVVTLKNMSTNTVDIKGWKIVNKITGDSFIFPTTSVPVNGQIYIGPEKTGKVFPVKNTILLNASGREVLQSISKNIVSSGWSMGENNPYDTLSATGDIELLSDINPDAFVTQNNSDTESRFGASIYQLGDILKNILRQGKSPIVVLVLLLGIVSGIFFLAEYYIYKKQNKRDILEDNGISGDTDETML